MTTYRVEIRYARQGWFPVAHHGAPAVGLAKRAADAIADAWREHEAYYAALGARPNPIRVVRESVGAQDGG